MFVISFFVDAYDLGLVRQDDESSEEEEEPDDLFDDDNNNGNDAQASASSSGSRDPTTIARAYEKFHALSRHQRVAVQQCLSTALFDGPSGNFRANSNLNHPTEILTDDDAPNPNTQSQRQQQTHAGIPSSVNAVRLPRMNRLVRKLHVRRMLPAIIFQHARNQVANLFSSIFPSDKVCKRYVENNQQNMRLLLFPIFMCYLFSILFEFASRRLLSSHA
jgi:hypothetical protein